MPRLLTRPPLVEFPVSFSRTEPTLWPPLAISIRQFTALGLGGRSTAYKLMATGELRAVKQGRRRILLFEDVVAYARSLPVIEPKLLTAPSVSSDPLAGDPPPPAPSDVPAPSPGAG
jgi:hypothetical protein